MSRGSTRGSPRVLHTLGYLPDVTHRLSRPTRAPDWYRLISAVSDTHGHVHGPTLADVVNADRVYDSVMRSCLLRVERWRGSTREYLSNATTTTTPTATTHFFSRSSLETNVSSSSSVQIKCEGRKNERNYVRKESMYESPTRLRKDFASTA